MCEIVSIAAVGHYAKIGELNSSDTQTETTSTKRAWLRATSIAAFQLLDTQAELMFNFSCWVGAASC